MKIYNIGPGKIDLYIIQHEKNREDKNERTVREQDRAEISTRGRELQKYREVLAAMPDVRADKIKHLKEEIARGTYKPDAGKIAEKMLKEGLLDKLV